MGLLERCDSVHGKSHLILRGCGSWKEREMGCRFVFRRTFADEFLHEKGLEQSPQRGRVRCFRSLTVTFLNRSCGVRERLDGVEQFFFFFFFQRGCPCTWDWVCGAAGL